jgi:hypothetical protein
MLGEIRVFPVNEVPGQDVFAVTLDPTSWRDGVINLVHRFHGSNHITWPGRTHRTKCERPVPD